jgi:hypothetical protein
MTREMAHKVIVPKEKIMSQSFLNSGTLVILCLFATMGPQFYSFLTMEKYNVLLLLPVNNTYIEKTPRKFEFGKKSAEVYHCLYSSIEQLQVAL